MGKHDLEAALDLCIARFNAFSRLQDELDRTKSALEERKVIDRAKGILMKAKNISARTATTGQTPRRPSPRNAVARTAHSAACVYCAPFSRTPGR